MKNLLAVLGCLLCVLGQGGVQVAYAVSIEATITADNHYALYYGTPGAVTFVGRNELGHDGSPGAYNWSLAETWTFATNPGDSVYVVGWSDDYVAQGWIGEFNLGDGTTVYSSTQDWVVDFQEGPSFNLGDGSPAPTTAEMQTQIASANWVAVNYGLANGSGPWGTIAQLDSGANWIWGTPLLPGSGSGEYQIFKWSPESVPEPSSLLLLGAGMMGLGLARRMKARRA